tara:strand:- start:81 stop:497 length:417 start_codon:yes stop_codon:yes gene_type:complete
MIKLQQFENNQAKVKGEVFAVRRSDCLDNTDRSNETVRHDDSETYIAEMRETYGPWVVANLIDDALPVKARGRHNSLRTRKTDPLNKVKAAEAMETDGLPYQGGKPGPSAESVGKDFEKLSDEQKAAFEAYIESRKAA